MTTVIQNDRPSSESSGGSAGIMLAVVVLVIVLLGLFFYYGGTGGGGNSTAPAPDVNTTEIQNEVVPDQPSGDVNVDVPDEIDVNVEQE